MDGQMPQTPSRLNSLAIPIAIVISAALIAGAIYMSGNKAPAQTAQNPEDEGALPSGAEVLPVTEADHIRGNPNAPIVLVEYSDYDCPFCKNFHETMQRVMTEYGDDGKVAWVYRHFPLEQLHPNAPKIAAASECVAELGGNNSFWTFTDLIFSERGTNDPTDMNRLSEFAETAGVNRGQFELCYNSGKYSDAIAIDFEEALAAGGRGTPYTVAIIGDQQAVISGAQPYDYIKAAIDAWLDQLEGRVAS
jgi:protein-disulfide isomerase